ncbi:MAG: glycosyltransferase [Eubacterium sp.]|nr:glycosyltransferase [Eubacterium sp.]
MERKLKIAIGTDAFPPTTDGISNVAVNYAAILNAKHCEAVVVTPKNPNQQDDKYPYEIFRYKSWWIPSKEGYSVGWPFKESLSYDIIDKGFDLLHSHAPLATSYYFRRVNRIKRIPTVLTYHTKYEYDIKKRVPTERGKRFARRFLLNNINSANEVWVTSNGSLESLRKLGYEGEAIVMPNGCDMPKTEIPQEITDSIKDKHGIPKNIPVFIYAGRMIWYKNIRLILEACNELKKSGKDFRLIMLGFGADENKIKRRYRSLGIADKIVWVGKILDRELIQKYYAASDILLFPSVFDTNGLVVREAASCATPTLLVEGSCAAEGIQDRETGFFCKESSQSIANVLSEIMEDKALLKSVGKSAQENIYISWEEAVGRAFERYQKVINDFYSVGKSSEDYKY